MSTVEALDSSGCSLNPTKSLCSPSVFNTAITRAKSLIVAVGNPYILMRMEKKMGSNKQCWAEYLNRCFEMGTVVQGDGVSQNAIQDLQEFVKRRLQISPSTGRPIIVQEGSESENKSTQVMKTEVVEKKEVKQLPSMDVAAKPNPWPSTSALRTDPVTIPTPQRLPQQFAEQDWTRKEEYVFHQQVSTVELVFFTWIYISRAVQSAKIKPVKI